MEYDKHDVKKTVWGDQGVQIQDAKSSNPHINDAEYVEKGDALNLGAYAISPSGITHLQVDENHIPSILYGNQLPERGFHGEKTKSPLQRHINLSKNKEVAELLSDLDAIYLMTIECEGANQTVDYRDKQVTVMSGKPRSKATVYQLEYSKLGNRPEAVGLVELTNKERVNNILNAAGISKDSDGLYYSRREIRTA